MDIRTKLTLLRRLAGFTQQNIADALELSQKKICNVEKLESDLSTKEVELWCAELKLTPEEAYSKPIYKLVKLMLERKLLPQKPSDQG